MTQGSTHMTEPVEVDIEKTEVQPAAAQSASAFSQPILSADFFINLESKKTRRKALGLRIGHYMSTITSWVVQGVAWPFFFVAYNGVFDLRITGKRNLRGIKGPVLFISNHISFYDSFIFDLFTPPFSGIPPYRFMGTSRFEAMYLKVLNMIGIVPLVYLFFGVFKVTNGQGVEKALVPAYEIIQHGGTVCIFPEGRMWTKRKIEQTGMNIGPFKWGAAFLAKNTGVQVVPVALKKVGRGFRSKLIVNVGKPYFVDESKDPHDLAEEMRDKVLALHA